MKTEPIVTSNGVSYLSSKRINGKLIIAEGNTFRESRDQLLARLHELGVL